MSVIVAIKDKDKIIFGADSQVTKGGTRQTLKNPNNYKIWKVRGVEGCMMGHVGLVRDSNIVRLMDGLVSDYAVFKDYIDYEYVVKSVFPDIMKELKEYGYYKDSATYDDLESTFFFAYRDQLYILGSDGSVIEVDDYAAIGSGSSEAIGSLLSTEDDPNPKSRVIKAIKASAANDIYVDYPIIVSDTNSSDFDIITEANEKDYLKR